MHAMASTTWPWMLMVKIVRSSSTSALVNPIFKFTRLSHCWMRLETSYINQQKVSDTRSSRLLTCGAAYWKPSGPETGDIAANNRSREDGQREQTRSRRSKPPTRSRTPWLGKWSSPPPPPPPPGPVGFVLAPLLSPYNYTDQDIK